MKTGSFEHSSLLLDISGMTHYFGGLCAVSDFNLKLHSGELMGLIGPNGAGKTTVFNLITGVYRPARGSIKLMGREIAGRQPSAIASRGIARTFQNIRLFKNLSVLENVRIAHYAETKYSPLESLFHFGRYHKEEERIRARSLELLASLKLENYADAPSASLPYGLQRRLEIARALAARPQILLLDEPAAGMNPNEIGGLMEFIQWIRKEFKLTILLIEHQMKLVMGICERIMVLDFGATLAEGLPSEIQSNQQVMEAYLGHKEPSE